MLIFIPAITMSVWAEERRQGTDELLLTIPATDFDIVLGKYLAAASIFTCSLLFSQLTSFAVLNSLTLGDLDTGLFFTTYLGYWFVGMMMLAIGMVASFLTGNLTVGFILGAVFNAPLVILALASTGVAASDWAQVLSEWSISGQLADFSRGVISLSSVTYFVMIAIFGIYLCMVLIGRRHWLGGRDGDSMLGHYFVRTIALLVVALAINAIFSASDLVRWDLTSGRVSSLSGETKKMLKEFDPPHAVQVEAFISRSMPDVMARTRFELISLLNELRAAGGGKVKVRIHDGLEQFDDQATRAEEQFGIEPVAVRTKERGAHKLDQVVLGAVFTCGLQRVVVPFFGHGIPVEYELTRSVSTVASEEKLRLGVLRTDAELFGGINFQTFQPRPRQQILDELEKQYEIVDVDPNSPIEKDAFDVLLAVQPSSLTQPQMDNLIEAIKAGQPTAIFEDPFPIALASAPGTSQPKRPRGSPMMGMRQPPEPKGDIQELWDLLGIQMVGGEKEYGDGFDAHIIWQQYNPYQKVSNLPFITDEWVFASSAAPGIKEGVREAMDPDCPAVDGLHQLLFLYPGAVKQADDPPKGLRYKDLVMTGDHTGIIKHNELQSIMMSGDVEQIRSKQDDTNEYYTLAAMIETASEPEDEAEDAEPSEEPKGDGKAGDKEAADEQKEGDEEKAASDEAAEEDSSDDEPANKGIHVVFVTDIDLLHSDFLNLRAQPDSEIAWKFDNVTFVLNIIDLLAAEAAERAAEATDDEETAANLTATATDLRRFIEIRKRQLRHSTLRTVELQAAAAREEANEKIEKAQKDWEDEKKKAEDKKEDAIKKAQEEVDELKKRDAEDPGSVSPNELRYALLKLDMRRRAAESEEEKEKARIERQLKRDLKQLERNLELQVRGIRNTYKLWAVILPPIPPLLVAFVVFVRRRLREREGVTRTRLR
jgi:ABC-2 type transport system permease protein